MSNQPVAFLVQAIHRKVMPNPVSDEFDLGNEGRETHQAQAEDDEVRRIRREIGQQKAAKGQRRKAQNEEKPSQKQGASDADRLGFGAREAIVESTPVCAVFVGKEHLEGISHRHALENANRS
jgi:hypothetical protein